MSKISIFNTAQQIEADLNGGLNIIVVNLLLQVKGAQLLSVLFIIPPRS